MNCASTEHQHLPEAIAPSCFRTRSAPGGLDACVAHTARRSIPFPDALFDPCDALSQIKAGA
jgi:hypothetical protein